MAAGGGVLHAPGRVARLVVLSRVVARRVRADLRVVSEPAQPPGRRYLRAARIGFPA